MSPSSAWLGGLSILGLLTYPLPSAWVALGGLLLLAALWWRRRGRLFAELPFIVPLGLYLAGASLGLMLTIRPESAKVRYFGLLAAMVAFFLLLGLVGRARVAGRLVGGALIALAVAVLLLLLIIAPTERAIWLPHGVVDAIAAIPGLANVRELTQGDAPNQRYRLTAAGLGSLAAYGTGLALGPLLAGTTRRERALGLLAAAYFGGSALLSGSRGAVLSTALVLLLIGAPRHRWLLAIAALIVAGLVAVLAGLVPADVVDGVTAQLGNPSWRTGATTLNRRLEIWQNVLFLLGDFPYTGAGLGPESGKAVYDEYFILPPGLHYPYHHAHNIFLQSYLEQGLLGLVGMVGLVGAALVVGWRIMRSEGEPLQRAPAISAVAAVLALILVGLTEITPLSTVGMVMLFGALGLLAALKSPRNPTAVASQTGRRSSRLAVGGAMVGLCLVVLMSCLATALVRGGAPTPSGWTDPGRQFRVMLADFYVNLSALEVVRAKLDSQTTRGERIQRFARSQGYLDTALRYDPGNPRIYRNLAAGALIAGNRGLAGGFLAQAEAFAPAEDGQLFFQLGRLYQEAGDVEAAISAWERTDPTIGAWNGSGPSSQLSVWGARLAGASRWTPAAAVNAAAIRLEPANPEPYPNLALALTRLADKEAALRSMQELAQAYPDIPWAYIEITNLHKLLGQRAEARFWDRLAQDVQASPAWEAQRRLAAARNAYVARLLD